MENSRFRAVNTALDIKPRLGPIPASQILPFSAGLFIAYIAHALFKLSFLESALLWILLGGTSWALMGDRPWKFFIKFWSPPDLVRGFVRYQPLLSRYEEKNRSQKNRPWQRSKSQKRSQPD